jgi:hypothetical protein
MLDSEDKADPGHDFKLKRYEFILQEIRALNENIHKYLTLFQTLITAIVGGGVALFVSWKELKINVEIARVGIQGLLGLMVILTQFVIILIIIGMISWFDYRKDEVKLLNEVIGPKYRQPPKIGNLWRWHETWLIIFLMSMMITIYWFTQSQVLPLIHS